MNTPTTVDSVRSTQSCLNCATPLLGAHCHACGQKARTHRLTLGAMLHDIPHAVFHVDRSIFGTLRALLTRPGRAMNEYLDGKRVRYFNPLTLMVLFAGISTLIFSVARLEASFAALAMSERIATEFQEFYALTLKYYTASLALFLPLAALSSWVFFRAWGRSFGEHLVINAFITAVTTASFLLIVPALAIVESPKALTLIWTLSTSIVLVYQSTAFYAVFAAPKRRVLAATWSLAAVALYVLLINAFTYGFFFFVYLRL